MNRQRRRAFLIALLLVAFTGCHRHKHADLDIAESAEPDRILYEKSVEDIQNKRFDVARLTLQTLLNTYPDSDYLAEAKLAIADSYFQEGTTGTLTHAEVEYKDFITFFPNSPQVDFAQYRAALCNFRRLEKPDRDRTYAQRAERELQLLLRNYPDSEYAADGEKKLLQVQEVLAEGEFRIARFYYIRETWRASASRLADLVERYPNFSRRDQALWMLGRTFERAVPYFWQPDPERAAENYARLVREHPLSDYVQDAKESLNRLGYPVPEPDPVLLARAQTVKPALTEEDRPGLLGRLFGMFGGRPDTSAAAARLGPPPLEPPQEEPYLPPPLMTVGRNRNTVAVQTTEALPAGTVQGQADPEKQAAEGEAGNTQGSGTQQQAPPPPKKKKSFWRKLIPFV